MTLAEYAARWLTTVAATRKVTTTRRYEQLLRAYIVPALGEKPLASVTRGDCKALLVDLLDAERAVPTVRACLAVLQSLFATALVDDELVPANPAAGLSRRLRLVPSRRAHSESVSALTVEELRRFLAMAWERVPHLAVLFEVYGRAGLRLGEGLALTPEAVTPTGLRITQTYTDGRFFVPKAGHARTVELTPRLRGLLAALPAGSWLFPSTRTNRPWNPSHIERVCTRLGERLGLRGVDPRTLRHSFASILLAQGEPPEWVSRQLGHARLDLTIVTYGRWLTMTNPQGLEAFDALLDGHRRPAIRAHRLVPGGRLAI